MTKCFMCIYKRRVGISVPNMKFLCLILWLGWVCTDDVNTDDAADAEGAQSMIVYGSLVDKPKEPKTSVFIKIT